MSFTTGPPWKERQPDAPQVSTSPLDTLTPKPTDSKNLLRSFEPHIILGFVIGAGSVLLYNKHVNRPWYSSIHLTLLTGVTGAVIYKLWDISRWERHKERDEMMREYILMHPEDFPPYDRKKYKDMFMPWIPIR